MQTPFFFYAPVYLNNNLISQIEQKAKKGINENREKTILLFIQVKKNKLTIEKVLGVSDEKRLILKWNQIDFIVN